MSGSAYDDVACQAMIGLVDGEWPMTRPGWVPSSLLASSALVDALPQQEFQGTISGARVLETSYLNEPRSSDPQILLNVVQFSDVTDGHASRI